MEKITSKNNTLIKDTKKLFTSSKARYENNLIALEGARLCFDVLNSVLEIKYAFVTEDIKNKYPDETEKIFSLSEKSYIISPDVSEKLSETKSPQGIFLLASMPKGNKDLGQKVIALDKVQDPSNVGAIIRSAEALGISSIIAYDCCDIYNPKALRSSMGSTFRMNIDLTDDLEVRLNDLKSKDYKVYSTVPDGSARKITDVSFSDKSICVIGNEANGVEENIKNISDDLITIPMLGRAESLNASVASAITMWEMLK